MSDLATGRDAPPAPRGGPRLVWFAVLGGPLAWAVHLLVAWLLVELACAQGRDHLAGMPLRLVVAMATVVPGAVALLAWLAAGAALRAAPDPDVADDRRLARMVFMARVGAWLDLLSLMMIVFGAAAVATFAPCVRGVG